MLTRNQEVGAIQKFNEALFELHDLHRGTEQLINIHCEITFKPVDLTKDEERRLITWNVNDPQYVKLKDWD